MPADERYKWEERRVPVISEDLAHELRMDRRRDLKKLALFAELKATLADPAQFDCVQWRKKYAPALLDELERLRGEVATAKTLGAAEELERYCLECKTHFDALPGRLLNGPYFVNIENLQRRAATLRKELP